MIFKSYTIDEMVAGINQLLNLESYHPAHIIAEVVEKYDFIVGSIECRRKLMWALPEPLKAHIISSPYMPTPTTVFLIAKTEPDNRAILITEALEEWKKEHEVEE